MSSKVDAKVVILGMHGVGKGAIVERYLHGNFTEQITAVLIPLYILTIKLVFLYSHQTKDSRSIFWSKESGSGWENSHPRHLGHCWRWFYLSLEIKIYPNKPLLIR